MKKTVKDIEVKGKRALVRCDFNVPLKDGVITDDIRMKPVDLLYKSVSLKKAFTSGADIILFKYRKDDYKVINKVIKMVKTGKIKEEDIDKSVARIIRIKEKYNISDKKKINGCNIEELNKQIEELNSILN